ncbi:hypothetical protein ACFSPU_04105 [Haoranjiania flava]|uniref:Uncharacterized protein n=1 Tax=Haoranjiania flava TaxID=1856322 RepID=A0AAE3IMX0_9BACT|nr:hypothetical protein [Haoranjiania flava]MCU7694854.1 hypothetical protein [Haoranjiania flava]
MKVNRSKELKNRFFNAETSPAEEKWLRANAGADPYFDFIKETQQDAMDWNFDTFMQAVEADGPVQIKPARKNNFTWYAAASVMIMAIAGLFLMSKDTDTADAFAVNSVGSHARNFKNYSAENVAITRFQAAQQDPPIAVHTTKSIRKNKRIQQHAQYETPENSSAQNEAVAYVYVNGKPVYDEAEAEKITLESLGYFAKNIKTGIKEMSVIKNLSINL